jgi:hypothetical protein
MVGKHVHPGFTLCEARYLSSDSRSFAKATKKKQVGCCFLRDVDISASRIAELQGPLLLQPTKATSAMTVNEIAAGLQSLNLCNGAKLAVQSIGVRGYTACSTNVSLQ